MKKVNKTRCTKCGGKDIYIKYLAEDRDRSGYFEAGLKERLLCYCRICSYEWTEPTLDRAELAPRKASVK